MSCSTRRGKLTDDVQSTTGHSSLRQRPKPACRRSPSSVRGANHTMWPGFSRSLEGFAGRECARRRDPTIVGRLRTQYERMRLVAGNDDRSELLSAKTEFYAALMEGCGNVFVERFLKMLLNRVTVLRATSMSQPDRIGRSLDEIGAILAMIEGGYEDGAERACVQHVENAAAVALEALRRGSA